MADSTISANMNLVIPTVGQDLGPQWATDLNTSLTLIDQHNHTPGLGVPVPPSGLNINADLPINDNNLTLIRSSRYQPQTSPISDASDLGAVYVSGVDLYFNDVNGNQIRLTQSGSIVGTAGSITGLVSPASASYSTITSTFVFQSNVNTAANLDGASIVLRNLTANSFGLTLEPPTLSSNYALVLPTLPSSLSFLSIDASGNIAPFETPPPVPGTTSFVTIDPAGHMASSISATRGITVSNIQAPNIVTSGSSNNFNTSSTSFVNVTPLQATITTAGNAVEIFVQPDGTGTPSFISVEGGGTATVGNYQITRNGTPISVGSFGASNDLSSPPTVTFPVGSIRCMDLLGGGSYSYQLQVQVSGDASTINVVSAILVVREVK